MLEQLLFYILAISFIIIMMAKIVIKKDKNYSFVIGVQLIGVLINLIQTLISDSSDITSKIIIYCLAIFLPLVIIILEINHINFSELFSVFVAGALLNLKQSKTAKNILIDLITKYPESYRGHIFLAKIYENEGGMRRAIDEYVAAIDINKKDYDSYYRISELLNELNRKDEAITMLSNLLKSKPDYKKAPLLLGELLCETGREKEAVNVYLDALMYDPFNYDLYYCLGMTYTMLNDFQSAKECYEKAAELNHFLFGALYNLGLIYLIEKDYEEAEKYLKESLYDEELEASAYYHLAKLFALKGEKEKAINFLNKSIELNPDLLHKAAKEVAFSEIKQYITVSVKMDEEDELENEEDELKEKKKKYKNEEEVRKHLEDTNMLVENINDNTMRQLINEKVDDIFNREKEKQERQKERHDD